jgi:hypothetical protein
MRDRDLAELYRVETKALMVVGDDGFREVVGLLDGAAGNSGAKSTLMCSHPGI